MGLLTTREVAAKLGISVERVNRKAAAGEIPAAKPHGFKGWIFDEERLRDFFAKNCSRKQKGAKK